MHVTAFNAQRRPEVSVSVSNEKEAAALSLTLAEKSPYVKVEDGEWALVFNRHTGFNKARLAHVIQHRAAL